MDQKSFFPPESDWTPPDSFPDLTQAKEIAIDLETRDPLLMTHGPSWACKQGEIIGTVVSTGRSTGPHLDFRINWVQTRLDPMSVLN